MLYIVKFAIHDKQELTLIKYLHFFIRYEGLTIKTLSFFSHGSQYFVALCLIGSFFEKKISDLQFSREIST